MTPRGGREHFLGMGLTGEEADMEIPEQGSCLFLLVPLVFRETGLRVHFL